MPLPRKTLVAVLLLACLLAGSCPTESKKARRSERAKQPPQPPPQTQPQRPPPRPSKMVRSVWEFWDRATPAEIAAEDVTLPGHPFVSGFFVSEAQLQEKIERAVRGEYTLFVRWFRGISDPASKQQSPAWKKLLVEHAIRPFGALQFGEVNGEGVGLPRELRVSGGRSLAEFEAGGWPAVVAWSRATGPRGLAFPGGAPPEELEAWVRATAAAASKDEL